MALALTILSFKYDYKQVLVKISYRLKLGSSRSIELKYGYLYCRLDKASNACIRRAWRHGRNKLRLHGGC